MQTTSTSDKTNINDKDNSFWNFQIYQNYWQE